MIRGDLKTILDAGDVNGCIAYYEQATEEERKAVAGMTLEWYAVQDAKSVVPDGPDRWRINPLLPAASAAFLASGSLSQLKKRGRSLSLADDDFRILAARKPDWITEYAAWSLERFPQMWPAVRKLERAGLCRRPETEQYVLGLIMGVGQRGRKSAVRTGLMEDPELLEREVWRLFEVEGSGEFSLAAHDKYSHGDATWETALLALAADGTLPRDRLLDASLDALERDFAQFRAGWFSRFHEALKPTLDERAERLDRYLNLLASKIPPTVSFALDAVAKLDRAKRLPAEPVVERIGPVLAARGKGTVSSALKLLAGAVTRDQSLKRRAAMIAAQALMHESPDLQGEAFELIQRCGGVDDESLLAVVHDQLALLAPSIQPRVREWLGAATIGVPKDASPEPSPAGELEELVARASSIAPQFRMLAGVDAAIAAIRLNSAEVPAVRFDGTEFPRLDSAAEIQPIGDLDTLIEVFSAVLENTEATDDIERVLDGVSRLCADRPADFDARTKPLCKRATALLERNADNDQFGPFLGVRPVLDLCGLALAWAGGVVLDPDDASRYEQQYGNSRVAMWQYKQKIGKWSGIAQVIDRTAEMLFLSRRTLAVARRAAVGQAGFLMSAPTHRGGWIDPRVLVDRLTQKNGSSSTPELHDQILAILRLAPDHRTDAAQEMGEIAGEFAQAVRYALGGDIEAPGPTTARWVAAARSRAPFDDDSRLLSHDPGLGPDAGAAAKFAYRVKIKSAEQVKSWPEFHLDRQPTLPPKIPCEYPTVRLHVRLYDRQPATIRWCATVWPIARESWLAQGVEAIGSNLDWWGANWWERIYLEALTDPDLPLKPMALVLLTLGLAAKQADEQGLATDALIAAIDDGRIDGPLLGGSMRSLLPTTLIKPPRWAKALRDAAPVSTLHAQVVAHAIQHALGEELVEPPRDLLALLELLRELLIEIGEPVSHASARSCLAAWKVSGKTKAIIKDLLAQQERHVPSVRQGGLVRALQGRIERAERWSRSTSENSSCNLGARRLP